MSLLGFCEWLATTHWSIALHESLYMYPWVESTHVLSLMLFLGTLIQVDLRLMGWIYREVPVAEVTARVLTLLDELGVGRQYIDTTGATVQPNYRWNRQTEQQELLGYIAERRIDIEIRDLDILGKVVEGSVKAGVNRVSPPALDSTERRMVYREALARAAADARDNAGVLVDSLDVKLGPVIRIDAGGNPSPPRPMMRAQQDTMAAAELAPATYNAGDIRFDAVISVVFALQ